MRTARQIKALDAEPPYIGCFLEVHEVSYDQDRNGAPCLHFIQCGYRSQMAAIVRDTNGATAVSYWTWSLFAASHLSTVVAYTLVAVRDWQMVTALAINAVCCISIILLGFISAVSIGATAD